MAFCSDCGKPVTPTDVFCGSCGARQPVRETAKTKPITSTISDQTASLLCYIPFAGWIASIVVLASDRFRRSFRVRFHAFQGLYLFVAWLIANEVVGPIFRTMLRGFRFDKVLEFGIFVVWIFMLIKVSQRQDYSLPILGELAEKSATDR